MIAPLLCACIRLQWRSKVAELESKNLRLELLIPNDKGEFRALKKELDDLERVRAGCRQLSMHSGCYCRPCTRAATVIHALRLLLPSMHSGCYCCPCTRAATAIHALRLLLPSMQSGCYCRPCNQAATACWIRVTG